MIVLSGFALRIMLQGGAWQDRTMFRGIKSAATVSESGLRCRVGRGNVECRIRFWHICSPASKATTPSRLKIGQVTRLWRTYEPPWYRCDLPFLA
ncbi:hypothetical protein EDB81DRAFT_785099 [Dactylonectria macrodidyma]|uniref:Uncharacterized protein n=1 Tax=Dactylonectria macrodidyma TaxID=307937 RepID=A0A9P9FH67_9HYPO|nr:hypothetical protein EDB81DRAFT_785099 [Dactylonectria macrodidyma]